MMGVREAQGEERGKVEERWWEYKEKTTAKQRDVQRDEHRRCAEEVCRGDVQGDMQRRCAEEMSREICRGDVQRDMQRRCAGRCAERYAEEMNIGDVQRR
jgi:hypothetical protein